MSEATQDIVKAPKQDVNAFTKMPNTFEQAQRYCEYLASSKIVPKQYQGHPQDIFVAISWGQQVGLTNPMLALKNISVINGSPAMWGDAPLALVRKNPLCEFILEDNEAFAYARDHIPGWEHLKDVDPNSTSICVGKRVGEPMPAAREFSVEDVNRAKLGNVHKSYPKDMRKYKARDRLLRSLFADITEGIAQAELVKEQMEMEGKKADPEEFKDGLDGQQPDTLGEELADSLKDPEAAMEKKEDVTDAEVIEETDGSQSAEAPETEPDPDPEEPAGKKENPGKWAQHRTVQDIVKSAKWLDKETGNDLAQLISKQNGKLTTAQADQWKDKIRGAHEEHKKNKS